MLGISAAAQQPPPAKPTPEQPPPKPTASEPPRQPINIRIEVTISDQPGKAPGMKKTVTAVSGEGRPARVRAQDSGEPVSEPRGR